VFLTIQVLHYCADVRNGRDELLHLDPDVDLPRDDFDQASALSHALLERKLPEFLQVQPPQSATYAALKAALENYHVVAEKGGWGELPPTSKFEAKDVDAETLAFLQRRLKLEDPAFASNPSPAVSDINSAIRRFQISNGLDADGVVGRATLAALNVSTATRVAQIAANMERLRWLPHTPEKSYVTVNVPNATLVVVGNGVELLSSRVIVGRPNDRTPIFRAMITEVVANPPWVVPKTIARAEILPKLRKNPSYLVDHQMIMANGQIRQLPGPTNALGFLKLNVSDRFAVYLHDTPSRTLFARNERFLSHGCIRVQQIVPLASYALTGDVTGGAERLAAAIATGQTVRLTLKAPIPLYVNYFTAFLSADGSLQFRPDIYGRDARLIAAMRGRSFAQATSSTAVCRRPA
jgi:murein L,D-transpeptidase YcbB/YkuD